MKKINLISNLCMLFLFLIGLAFFISSFFPIKPIYSSIDSFKIYKTDSLRTYYSIEDTEITLLCWYKEQITDTIRWTIIKCHNNFDPSKSKIKLQINISTLTGRILVYYSIISLSYKSNKMTEDNEIIDIYKSKTGILTWNYLK